MTYEEIEKLHAEQTQHLQDNVKYLSEDECRCVAALSMGLSQAVSENLRMMSDLPGTINFMTVYMGTIVELVHATEKRCMTAKNVQEMVSGWEDKDNA